MNILQSNVYTRRNRVGSRLLSSLSLGLLLVPALAFGQSRDFHAQRIVLDDNNGNQIIIQTPVGGITGGVLTLPDPAGAGTFIITNPAGGSQSLNGDLIPSASSVYSLGSLTNNWKDLFLSGTLSANSIVGDVTGNVSGTAATFTGSLSGDVTSSGMVTSISNGVVTPAKLDATGATAGQALTYDGTNVAWTTPDIADDAVTSAKIADGSIVSADISASAAIPYSKLSLGGSIAFYDLTSSAVTTPKIANNAVTPAKLSVSGATTGQALIYDGTNAAWGTPTASTISTNSSLTGAGTNASPLGLNDDAVTSAKIADGSIMNADISASASIAYSKLSLSNSIQNGDLVASSITTSKVANGTVTTSKMADSAISGLKLLTYAVTNRHIADGAVTAAKLSGSGASNGEVLTYNSGTNTVAWSNPSVGLAFSRTAISNANSPYAIAAGTDIVGVDVTAGPVTVALPAASSVASGRILIVKNELGNAATNNITINPNGTDLINAASTSVTINAGTGVNSYRFYSDGVSRWHQF